MLTIEKSLMSNLMDDLAKGIYKYLYESSTEFEGNHFVLVPVTDVVKKFERNHRTIQRRISALKRRGITCAHNKEKHYHSLSNTQSGGIMATRQPKTRSIH